MGGFGGWETRGGWVAPMQCPIFAIWADRVWRPLSHNRPMARACWDTLQICRVQYSRSRSQHNVRPFRGPGALEGLCVPTYTYAFLPPCRPTAGVRSRYITRGEGVPFFRDTRPPPLCLCHEEGLHQHTYCWCCRKSCNRRGSRRTVL